MRSWVMSDLCSRSGDRDHVSHDKPAFHRPFEGSLLPACGGQACSGHLQCVRARRMGLTADLSAAPDCPVQWHSNLGFVRFAFRWVLLGKKNHWVLESPDKGMFVGTVRQGFRRLHRAGDCHVVPGVDYRSFEVLGSAFSSTERFDAPCK